MMESSRDIAALVAWVTSHGGYIHPSVEIYSDEETGLSFRVKADAPWIHPWETIVRLPSRLSLSYINAIDPPSPLFEAALGMKPHVLGRLLLIKEYLLREESFWWPYIRCLPQPEDVGSWALPPFWTSDEVELLDGTNVQIGIEKIIADASHEVQQVKHFLSEPPHHDSQLARSFTTTLYRWAYCIFSSRSFRPSLVLAADQKRVLEKLGVGVDDFSVLLPLFDIGNHDMTVEVRWEQSQQQQMTQKNETDQGEQSMTACELKINRTHHPGDQVFNNYGMKTNAELLLGYGFMIPPTEELHNDYIHVRKRVAQSPSPSAASGGDEYLISRRPVQHPSSLLARSRQALLVKPTAPLGPVLGSFQHVQHDMVWDIFCTLTQRSPVSRRTPEGEEERLLQERFFSGQILQRDDEDGDEEEDEYEDDDEESAHLEQTIAIIQHKILQELEKLDETDMHVEPPTPTLPLTPTFLHPPPTPTGASLLMPPPTPTIASMLSLTKNQRLALEYRNRCRRVLEETLTAMSGDDGIFDDEEDEDDSSMQE